MELTGVQALSAADYDEKMRLALLPLKDSPWLVLYLRAMALVARHPNQYITDLGCGTGRFARLVEACGFGEGYLGVDFSPARLNEAMEYVPGVSFYYADITRGDRGLFERGGLYVMLELLEHLPDDKALLTRIPKGAIVVISVPNHKATGHVRMFEKKDDVTQRYASLVDFGHIERVPLNDKKWFYLFSGVRR